MSRKIKITGTGELTGKPGEEGFPAPAQLPYLRTEQRGRPPPRVLWLPGRGPAGARCAFCTAPAFCPPACPSGGNPGAVAAKEEGAGGEHPGEGGERPRPTRNRVVGRRVGSHPTGSLPGHLTPLCPRLPPPVVLGQARCRGAQPGERPTSLQPGGAGVLMAELSSCLGDAGAAAQSPALGSLGSAL